MGNASSSTSSPRATVTVTVAGPTTTAAITSGTNAVLTPSSSIIIAMSIPLLSPIKPPPEITGTSSSISVQIITTAATTAAAQPPSATVKPVVISSSLSPVTSTTLTTQGAAALNSASSTQSALPEIAPVSRATVGPFEPQVAILGGIPTKDVDQPMTAVFLVLFLMGAATHFMIHEVNGKRGHKFHLSDAVFDFCMVRTVTCVMRIVWVNRASNQSVVVAALIFENAGVVVLFLVNAFFVQRITRAVLPNFGWNPLTGIFFKGVYFSIPFIIIWNIISLVGGFFTLDEKKLLIVRGFTIFGAVWTTLLSIFPVVFLAGVFAAPKSGPPENFGTGNLLTKVIMVTSSSVILFVGAIMRINSVVSAHPKDNPGVLNGKAVFYITGFLFEILVVIGYAAFRIDLRFHVPDGCHGPGDYSRGRRLSTDSTTDLTGGAAGMATSDNIDVNTLIDNYYIDEKATYKAESWTGKPTEAQVQDGLASLGLNHKSFGQTVDLEDSRLLFYVFEVQQDGISVAPEMGGVPRGTIGDQMIQLLNSGYAKRASGFYGSRPPPRQSSYGMNANRTSVRRMSSLYMI